MLVHPNIVKAGLLLMATAITGSAILRAQPTPLERENLNSQLAAKDSILFDAAFATCNGNQVDKMLDKDFVFYHDNGYLDKTTFNSRTEFLENIRKACQSRNNGGGPNMMREIVPGTLQVLAFNNNEAVQTGVQRFYIVTKEKPDQLVEESKFSREWQKQNGEWKIIRELDYLVNTKFTSSPSGTNSLYQEIAHMDSVLFNAFNNHDMNTFKNLFAPDLEFYHDKGGLTDYNYSIQSFANTIAQNNGLRRELVKGSLEVYPIKDYGAIQVGVHTFCHPENGKMDCGTFKFVHIWKKIGNDWKITRVVSYDH
jgi:hypothetical protein